MSSNTTRSDKTTVYTKHTTTPLALIGVILLCALFAVLIMVWIVYMFCRRRKRSTCEVETVKHSACVMDTVRYSTCEAETASSCERASCKSSTETDHIYTTNNNSSQTSTTKRWAKLLGNLLANNSDASTQPSIPFQVPISTNSTTCTPARRMSKFTAAEHALNDGTVNLALTPDSLVLADSNHTTPIRVLAARRASADSAGSYDMKDGVESLLCGIDPTLYKSATDDADDLIPDSQLGGIRFGIQLCLLPDTRCSQSKFRKRTCNPKFNENFVFQVSYKNLCERVLKLTVFDVDRLRRHNVVGHALMTSQQRHIGHALFPLRGREHDLLIEPMFVSLELQAEVPEILTAVEPSGELHVGLCYNDHIQRITVAIIEGRNLKPLVESSSPELYVKVCLMRQNSVVKSKRTDVVKRESDPKFNESFAFKLTADSLDLTSVVITAWQNLVGQKDKCLGRVVVGSFMFARGKELEHVLYCSCGLTSRDVTR